MNSTLPEENRRTSIPKVLRHTFGAYKKSVHTRYFATMAIGAVVIAFALSMFLIGALGK